MVAEWKKKGLEKLRERESEACASYTKNPVLTEKEQKAAIEKCIINVEKFPLEKQLEFIQEVKECKNESKKAKTPKEKEEFEKWCYADIPNNIFPFKPDKNLSFESPAGSFRCDWVLEDGAVCGQTFTTKHNLKQHINRIHRQLKPFVCNELLEDGTSCGQAFAVKRELKRHIDTVHRKLRPFVCNEIQKDGTPCAKAFGTKSDLDRHINSVHRAVKPFVCSELLADGNPCGQVFASRDNLKRHIETVHRKLKPFICNEPLQDSTPCGQAFGTKAELKRHIETVHRKLKPFICNESLQDGTLCEQAFGEKGSLKIHIDTVHRKLRPFVCNDLLEDGTPCGQAFARKGHLDNHFKVVHRKERSHTCSKCGKAFGTKSNRDIHEKGCVPPSDEILRRHYYAKKGLSVEDVIVAIIEQHCESINVPTTRQKEFDHPILGIRRVDLYCDGLEGKRIAIDVTITKSKANIYTKWTEKQYQEYPDIDELWVVVCSNAWDSILCAELSTEAHQDPLCQDVYIYHWKDLRDIKMMTIPPKIWKLLEIYERCTLENKEECKKHWEEAKARFHTF